MTGVSGLISVTFRFSSVKGSPVSVPEVTEKKRESRKSGFFNLIKSRTSRSEKNHGAAAITPPPPTSSGAAYHPSSLSSSISTVTEEFKQASPMLPHQELHRAQSLNHTDSDGEATPTAAEPNEGKEVQEVQVEEEHVDKENQLNPIRHVGVPVMGIDLLAEMKARQERMAVKKVSVCHSSALSSGSIFSTRTWKKLELELVYEDSQSSRS